MGANMARHLHDLKYQVTAVFDVNREAAASLAEEIGATACEKLADVTANADVIFTVVTNDAAMESIFFGKDDNLLTGAEGRLFVNCATLSPASRRRSPPPPRRKRPPHSRPAWPPASATPAPASSIS
jgi:3-hydroxyisobutyrate dehydrogenase